MREWIKGRIHYLLKEMMTILLVGRVVQSSLIWKKLIENKESKGRILALLNITAYIIEVIFMSLILIQTFFDAKTPISLEVRYIKVIWVIVLWLQAVFTLAPLIFNANDFYDLLSEKIGINFALIWVWITIFALIPSVNENIFITLISPILFFILKLYSHYFIYHRIKYHDEGNAYVSRLEFFSLHVTFSVIEAWITYLMFFSLFQVIGDYMDEHNEGDNVEDSEK